MTKTTTAQKTKLVVTKQTVRLLRVQSSVKTGNTIGCPSMCACTSILGG